MPGVFLSYSRADLPLIEHLAARLRASSPEILIWRDQEKIYGGQKWPKVLGEAIADQDIFLLAWSKNAAASHFVELEWNTAIALKKTIIPCLLDETPLAPSLRTFHGYSLQEVAGLTTSLATAPPVDQSRRTPVLAKLDDITLLDETAVLAQVKAIFAQHQWIVGGTVLQTGGDSPTHSIPTQSSQHRRVLGRWEKGVAIIAGVLGVIWTGIQIIDKFWPPPAPSVEGTYRSPNESSALQKVEQLGIVTAALSNFWADMNMPFVPFEKLDRELHTMAQRDRELQASLARWSASEAEVEELFHKAQQASEDLDYSKAEHLLDQAIRRDQQVAQELQEIATARLTLAAAKLVANGDVQAKQHDLVKAQDYYRNALKLLPLSDTKHRSAYRMKLGAVLREAGRGAAGSDIPKFFDEAGQAYHVAVTDSVKESPEWAEANFGLCNVLVEQAKFLPDKFSMNILTDAVGACKLALTVYTKAQFPDKWFFVTGKLATAMTQLALKLPLTNEHQRQLVSESQSLLKDWYSAGNDEHFVKSIVTNARTNSANPRNLGDPGEISPLVMDAVTAWLMTELSSETGDQRAALFDKSVKAWESMLTAFPMKQMPKQSTAIMMAIGVLRNAQAEYDTEEETRQRHRKQAIAAFEEGLKIFTVDQVPYFYVTLKLLIGHVSYTLGTQVHNAEGTEFLKKAKDSLRAALAVTPTPLLPQESAASQIMLGAVSVEEGTRTAGKERTIFLREAVQAYKEALKIITPESRPKLWRELLGELTKSSELLEDWQGVADSNRTVLTVYPDDKDALERARFSYHEKLFAYPAAFDLLKQWATRHPGNLSAQVNFAEAHLTTGHYREAERRLVELLRKSPGLDPRASLGLRMLEMTNSLALKKPSTIPQKLKELRTFVLDQPESFRANWIFDGTEHYVQTEQVFARYRPWLMDLLAIVRTKDRAALLAALDRVQASFRP